MSMSQSFTKNNIIMSLQGCVGINNSSAKVLYCNDNIMTVEIGFDYQDIRFSTVGNFTAGEDIKTTVETVGQLVIDTIIAASPDRTIQYMDGYERLHKNKQVLEVV